MKASTLKDKLEQAIRDYGDREVVVHAVPDCEKAALNDELQWMKISFGTDAAGNELNYPFEIWASFKGTVSVN